MSNKFKEGDRVILTGKTLIPYPDWPVWGSEFSCVGTVTQVRYNLGAVDVTWDNGEWKVVSLNQLSYFTGREENSLSPNVAFMLYKKRSMG